MSKLYAKNQVLHFRNTQRSDGGVGRARAVQASLEPPGRIATLILPVDTDWSEAGRQAASLPMPPIAAADAKAVEQAANALQKGEKAVILIRGSAPKERGLKLAARISGSQLQRLDKVWRRARQPCPGIQSIHRPFWGTTRDGGLVLMFFNRCERLQNRVFLSRASW